MRTEAVRAQLAAHGLGDRYREFTVSSATVALAAEALHCEAGRIAKTLSILTSTGPVLVVAMGLARLDNRKFKDLFHEKAIPRAGSAPLPCRKGCACSWTRASSAMTWSTLPPVRPTTPCS